VTGITAVAAALVGARYSPAEVAGALGSTNPVDISTALAAASVPAVYIQSALVDAFGPSGSLHDPLALADDLKALGFDPIAAGRALQALGLDPAHVGALLFVDGYSLADVATGILDALPASTATSGSWDHAVMGALRQIPSISGAGGFTTTDAAQALQALIGTTCDSSCMAEIGRAMFSAGYSASDVAGVLYSTYHEPLSQTYFDEPVGGLGYDLQVAGFTSVQVAQAEQAAPIGATDVQIAGSLLATTFNDGDCYTALTAVDAANSDPEESALAAMTQAGFGALRVGTVLDLLLQGQPLLVYQDLYYLGYGLSDVELVQFKLFPFNEQAFVNALGAAVPENDAGGGQGAGVLGGVFVKGLGSI